MNPFVIIMVIFVLVFVGIPVIYFMVPGSKPIFEAIRCAFTPAVCMIEKK